MSPTRACTLLLMAAVASGCRARSRAPDSATESATEAANTAPTTAKKPVQDTFHGVTVSEDYRWLEDGAAPEVKAWSDAQNAFARKTLDTLPGRAAIEKRVETVMRFEQVRLSHVTEVGDIFLALRRTPDAQQPVLVRLKSLEDDSGGTLLLDPNAEDDSGTRHIDWFVPSPDGKKVAVSISAGGSESGDVFIYDVESGEPIDERIPRVNGGTAGGDLAWQPNGKGFFYTRYPRGDERPAEDRDFYQQLYYHQLGTPTEDDRYELGKSLPRIAEIQLAMHEPSGRLLVTIQKGDGGEFEMHLRSPKGKWTQFSAFGDKHLQATFGPKNDLYVLSRAGAPRGRVLRVPLKRLSLGSIAKGKEVIAESEDTIVDDFWGPPTVRVTDSKLYVQYQLGGPSTIRTFTHAGKPTDGPKIPEVSAVLSMTGLGEDDLLLRLTGFLEPSAYYVWNSKERELSKTKLADAAPMDTSALTVSRQMATSKDGTKVPLNIIRPKDADGPRPCVVYGYGGYGVNLVPVFNPRNLMFAERGVVYVVTNIRGGGEFGEAWQRGGNLTNKQNVFDDFYAAIEHLKATKVCQLDRVGILGGSNGGLLMGATLVQHPEAAAAVVSFVGIYDMLRVELSPNGAFNVTEFGTVKDPAQFEALYAYSPYHNVKTEESYPPVLFITGENDPRVDPMQSRKMTARLQATKTEAPVLLRTTKDAGHGGSSNLSDRIAQYVDMYAFFFDHLGVEVKDATP